MSDEQIREYLSKKGFETEVLNQHLTKELSPEELQRELKEKGLIQEDLKKIGAQRGPGRGGPGAHGMMGPVKKAKDFKGTMKKLLSYLKAYRTIIITVIIFAMASAIFGIVGPKLMGKVTTEIFTGFISSLKGGVGINFDYIEMVLLTLLGLYILSSIFSYIQRYMMSGVSMRISYNLRKNIAEKINKLPLKYFDQTSHGEVLSRMTNDVETFNQTLNQSLSQLITSLTTVVGILVMMLSISVVMTLVALLILPLTMFSVMFIVKRSQKYFKRQQEYLGHVNGHIEEMYGSHLVVKAFNGEEKSIETFSRLNDELHTSAWKSQFLSGMMMPMMNIIGNIGYVLVSILGGTLVIKGTIQVGDIQAFIQYTRNFTQPLSQLANISNVLQQTVAAAERIFEFLEEDEELADESNLESVDHLDGKVSFENVRFGYNDEQIIINNFNAEVKSGQKVAIVGPTGAGKTTIVKLLMRFYDLQSGQIKIDGENINDMTRYDLRSQLGMVLQDTWLYNTSIMENIRYGRLDATDEEVIQAAKAAHADTFIHMLPDGYNMIINEDINNISEGQKQLLTIARTILKDPKILILDEATSSVDTRTEVQIQRAMDRLMEGRTSFIIAHRLSTIRDADIIFVMKDGDIIEQGNHENLLKQNGFYASLYYSQFEHTA
ncbi:MAG: ABC transporter ATP-binding protein [Clostridia bacterium]|nr:ABC transporter ATP-binding protein [Clostridia bacterium]